MLLHSQLLCRSSSRMREFSHAGAVNCGMRHIYNHFNAYVLPSGSSSIPDQNFPFLSYMKDSASPRSDLVYSRFVVTMYKHKLSWKGKYRRILCISPLAISTLDPSAGMALTNTNSLTHGNRVDCCPREGRR